MTKEEKLALLDKLGLKPSPHFGETREKVYRLSSNSYWSKVVGQWGNRDEPSERSIRQVKSLASQRNRSRRK